MNFEHEFISFIQEETGNHRAGFWTNELDFSYTTSVGVKRSSGNTRIQGSKFRTHEDVVQDLHENANFFSKLKR